MVDVCFNFECWGVDVFDMLFYLVLGGMIKLLVAWLMDWLGFECGYGDGIVGLSLNYVLVLIN